MSLIGLPYELPRTETSSFVRPMVTQTADERAAVSSDPPFNLASEFLRSLKGEVLSEVEQAIVVLAGIRRQLRSVGIPTIAPTPEGLVGLTWDSGNEHVNVQVHPDHRVEYFAEDLKTGSIWSDETTWGALSSGLITQLRNIR